MTSSLPAATTTATFAQSATMEYGPRNNGEIEAFGDEGTAELSARSGTHYRCGCGTRDKEACNVDRLFEGFFEIGQFNAIIFTGALAAPRN
jgi:hypothetical protein